MVHHYHTFRYPTRSSLRKRFASSQDRTICTLVFMFAVYLSEQLALDLSWVLKRQSSSFSLFEVGAKCSSVSFRIESPDSSEKHVQVPMTGNLIIDVLYEVGGIKNSEEDQGLVACRRRRKRGRHTPCLCKDMIINILLRLPARVLYEVMRCVCKEWNNIVSDPLFVSAHLQLASRGIIVQDRAKLNMVFNLQTTSAGLKVTKLRIPFPAILLGSCNGLLLLHDWTNPEVLHVMNLVTKVKISLPPVEGLTTYCGWFISLASTSSGLYKVLRVSRTRKKEVELMVYTVGVDKDWRVIDLEGMMMCDSLKTALLYGPPLISGYVYWLHPSKCTGYALDVDTETMHQFPAPEDYVHTCHPLYNINMVTSQGMIHSRRGGKWEVWELVERKSGIWKNVMVIDEDVVNSRLQEKFYPRTSENVRPLIILKNGELWLSCVVDKAWALVCYDLRKGNILVFPIKKAAVYVVPYLHVDTLLSLKNC